MWKPQFAKGIYEEIKFRTFQIFPEFVLKQQFKRNMGYELDLENPKTFNEKLQWLKLYWRDERATQLADKYLVRDYVISKGLGHLLNEIYGVYDHPDEIDPNTLPNEFVIKPNHSSGKVIFCRDKQSFDWDSARILLKKWLKRNLHRTTFEWVYKKIQPRIIIERLLEQDDSDELRDYRFFCFNGEPKFVSVDFSITNKKRTRRNIYNLDWELLDCQISYPNEKEFIVPKPEKLDEMISISQTLSSGFPHARVDLYFIFNSILFGEITFFHQSGIMQIKPYEFAIQIGEWLKLPTREFV